MYLNKLTISNFRKLKHIEFSFVDGLNIILGENNIGKTAVVDALRALLAGHEEPYPRITSDDIHKSIDTNKSEGDIIFQFVFSDLSLDDEADFLPALVPIANDKFEAHITICYSQVDESGRMRIKRWCGEHEEISMNTDMLENLRGVYLQPLRDASKGLRPGKNSKLARLLRLLGENDNAGKEEVKNTLESFDRKLKETSPFMRADSAITERHESMLGNQLSQLLSLGITGTNFDQISAKLSIQADQFDIDHNGLGYNNLIFMAVVLNDMLEDSTAVYRGLIIEEPEAHLHPQLQSILLDYLENIQEVNKKESSESRVEDAECKESIEESIDDDDKVQIFVTSHSPNFASIANLESTICLMEAENSVKVFSPREVVFDDSPKEDYKKRKKLERYLDVTRAEIFFARKIIFVEGAAEMLLVNVLAKKMGEQYNLRKHGVSVISVEGLNFDCFLPLFGKNAIEIPVSIITDADPYTIIKNDKSEDEKKPAYPSITEQINISDNTEKLLKRKDEFVKIFHGQKTFEYDLALIPENHEAMLSALSDLHPEIGKNLSSAVTKEETSHKQAITLFQGMFERGEGKSNVQKGRYAQSLAEVVSSTEISFAIPDYIQNAIRHVCGEAQ